jgi:hypothetical protein
VHRSDPAPARAVWAGDPERIDPDDYPARHPLVKLVTWAPCAACDLQVHALLTRRLLQGIICPGCGAQLLSPATDAGDRLAQTLRCEDRLSEQLFTDEQ